MNTEGSATPFCIADIPVIGQIVQLLINVNSQHCIFDRERKSAEFKLFIEGSDSERTTGSLDSIEIADLSPSYCVNTPFGERIKELRCPNLLPKILVVKTSSYVSDHGNNAAKPSRQPVKRQPPSPSVSELISPLLYRSWCSIQYILAVARQTVQKSVKLNQSSSSMSRKTLDPIVLESSSNRLSLRSHAPRSSCRSTVPACSWIVSEYVFSPTVYVPA